MRSAWIAATLLVVSTTPAAASGDSSQTLRVPVVDAVGRLTFERRVFTYPHYYAGTVTASEMILAAPCSKTKPADDSSYADLAEAPYDPRCSRINPLGVTGIALSFGIPGADEPSTHTACTLTVDLSKAVVVHPLLAKAGLGSHKAIVELAIRTLEDNASGNLFDCTIAYTGATATGDLPSIFRPVMSCGKSIARPWWKVSAAEQKARDVLDCTNVDRVVDLAAVVVGSRFEEALALLERARKVSEARTFERFAADPRFDELRTYRRGSDFFTALTSTTPRCSDRRFPTAAIRSVKLQGTECIVTLDKAVATLGPNQRWSTAGTGFTDEKYRPNVVRRLRFRDASTLVASAERLTPTEVCKPAMFDTSVIGAEADDLDQCTIAPVLRVLSKAEASEQAFQRANAKPLAEIQKIRNDLVQMQQIAGTRCTADEARRFATCHPGGGSCDEFKLVVASQCSPDASWRLDARAVDVVRAKEHQQTLATNYLACLATKYTSNTNAHGGTACTHRPASVLCKQPFPSVTMP